MTLPLDDEREALRARPKPEIANGHPCVGGPPERDRRRVALAAAAGR